MFRQKKLKKRYIDQIGKRRICIKCGTRMDTPKPVFTMNYFKIMFFEFAECENECPKCGAKYPEVAKRINPTNWYYY